MFVWFFEGLATSGEGWGEWGRGRGVDGKGIKGMINLTNIRELDQIFGIWNVFEGVSTSGKGLGGRGEGRRVGGQGTTNMINFSNIRELNQISSI